VKVDPALGHSVVWRVGTEVSGKAEPLVAESMSFRQLVGVNAGRIDIEVGEVWEQVGAGDPPAS
jgi:hypothetical protein